MKSTRRGLFAVLTASVPLAELFRLPARITDEAGLPYRGAKAYFYLTGTTTPLSVYRTPSMDVAHISPLVANDDGTFPPAYLDPAMVYRIVVTDGAGSVTLHDLDPVTNQVTLGELLFVQEGTGARARTAQAKMRELLSVRDFGASGNGVGDDTNAIQTALAYARQQEYAEKTLIFPAGQYNVSQINLRDCSFLTLHAQGTVQITGIDARKGFIVGDDRVDELGHSETFTQHLRITGGPWLIGPSKGQSYLRGLKLQNIKDSVFENLAVSGLYAPAAGIGNRIAVELELSFNNAFHNCTFALPGPPAALGKSYALHIGQNNANNNRFYNYRSAGLGPTIARTIGVRVDSTGNCFYGCDISAIHTCFELNAARGCHFINTYHESVSRVAHVIFASTGCVFMPSYVDIASSGTAYDLSGAQTVGFRIVGGNHRFHPSRTVGLAKGANCYGLTYQPGTYDSEPPATMITGTDRGSGGSALLDAFEMSAAKINFPDKPVPSANPTTLDAYQEGAWVPVYPGATLLGPGGAGSPKASYTKIGDHVTLRLWFSVRAEGGNSVRGIGGVPFEISDDLEHGVAIGYQVNPRALTFRMAKSGGHTLLYPIDPTDGRDKPPKDLSNCEFSLVVTYRAKA